MYWIEVSQLFHTVVIGTPRSGAKVIQVCWNEYQVRFFPDVMSVFSGRWSLLLPRLLDLIRSISPEVHLSRFDH